MWSRSPRYLLGVALALLMGLVALLSGASCTTPVEPSLSVVVTPPNGTLIAGQTAQLVVTRRYPGGPFATVTDGVTYTTSNRNVATVSEKGIVLGGPEGGLAIIRVADPSSDVVVSVPFTVVAVKVASISITPSPTSILRPGASRQFNATAHLNNGLSRDATAEVTWSSSNEPAATVGKTNNDRGVIYGVAEGDATITATDPASLVAGTTLVSVRGLTLQLRSILVEPNPAEIPIGASVQLGALGVFSDGSTGDVTDKVMWSSRSTAVATVDAKGLATGVAAGETTITATGAVSTVDAGADNGTVKGSTAATVR